jgi:hypothetical protein
MAERLCKTKNIYSCSKLGNKKFFCIQTPDPTRGVLLYDLNHVMCINLHRLGDKLTVHLQLVGSGSSHFEIDSEKEIYDVLAECYGTEDSNV